MLKKSATTAFTIVIVALFLLSSFSSLTANNVTQAAKPLAATSKPDCSKTTDADIVKAIKEQLQADPDIAPGMEHLNVSVKRRTVKLEGWLKNRNLIAKAIAIAKKSQCVRKVISKLKKRGGGSCGPGQKPCGGACIDRSSACNLGT